MSRELEDAWLDYYMACEAYDRVVCTGVVGRDGITPATAQEFGLINKNARREMAALKRRYPSATEEQWRAAKFFVLDHYDLKKEFDARRTSIAALGASAGEKEGKGER